MESMSTTCQANREINSLTTQLNMEFVDNNDNDNDSQLLLSQDKITDFLRGVEN